MIKVYIMVFGLALITSIGAAGYKIWTDMQEEIKLLAVKNQTLESAVELQDNTITRLQEDNKLKDRELQSTYTKLDEARRNADELEDRLSKHDIGMLAQKKPELMQRIVNNASNKALRCFELLSGAELNESERNAKNGNEFNSECPWLFDVLVTP